MPTHSELAAKLLGDAAAFFETIAEQNPPLAEQMHENADVFRQVGKLVEDEPNGIVEDETSTTSDIKEELYFFKREDWLHNVYGNINRGEPLVFSDRADRIEWQQVDDIEKGTLTDLLANSLSEAERALLTTAEVWKCEPGFYPDSCLYHATTSESDALFVKYIPHAISDDKPTAIALGRTSSNLHEVNRTLPLAIDGWEYDYLLFFMQAIRAENGKFRIIRNELLEYATRVLEAQDTKNSMDKLLQPEFIRFAGDGGCLYRASILYSDAVFSATLKVNYSGNVEMLDDEPIFDSFPHL